MLRLSVCKMRFILYLAFNALWKLLLLKVWAKWLFIYKIPQMTPVAHLELRIFPRVPRSLCGFFIEPLPDAIAEKGDRKRARRKAEKEEYGICVCCYLVCTGPSHLSYATCLTRLRLWLSGQEVQQGGPPPPHCYPHPISAVIDLSSGSLWRPLFWRSWVCELILDSDGDHFLFLPLFDRTPVSRYIDCYSLVKSVNFKRMPIFCRRQNLWRFLHGGPVQ